MLELNFYPYSQFILLLINHFIYKENIKVIYKAVHIVINIFAFTRFLNSSEFISTFKHKN